MVVFIFDRDMTVDTSFGPVPLEVIMKLKERYPVYAYGNPLLSAEAGIPYAQGITKEMRVVWVAKKHPYEQEIIVVDDVPLNINVIPQEIRYKITYMKPSDFVRVMDRFLL